MTSSPDPANEPEPEPERELTWAEVYRVNTCGGCQHANCPTCQTTFLNYLHEHGTNRVGDAKGATQ